MGNSNFSLNRRGFLKSAGVGLASAAIAPTRSRADEVVQLTMWSWNPNLQESLDIFEQAYPNIKVNAVNAGQGLPQYMKMRTAKRAGSGLPDLCLCEFQMVPSMRQAGILLDIAPYGAGTFKQDYVDWSWRQVQDGNAIYGMPSDSGPIALLYRQDLFDAHKLNPPATWDEFAEAAIKLRRDAPDIFLTDMQLNVGSWFLALGWQAGSRPFEVSGTTVTIRVNDEPAKKVAAFWQKLIDAHAVDIAPGSTAEWYQSYDRGRYASWITAAWGPIFLSQFARSSAGKWRVAPIPQWKAGDKVSANFGGSTAAVTTQTKHPHEATQVAMFLTHDPRVIQERIDRHFAFPTLKNVLDSEAFQDRPFPFYGNQPINRIFVESSREVDGSYQWSPFQDYVNELLGNDMSAAASGSMSLVASLDQVQRKLVAFAKAQGFTVKT